MALLCLETHLSPNGDYASEQGTVKDYAPTYGPQHVKVIWHCYIHIRSHKVNICHPAQLNFTGV